MNKDFAAGVIAAQQKLSEAVSALASGAVSSSERAFAAEAIAAIVAVEKKVAEGHHVDG